MKPTGQDYTGTGPSEISLGYSSTMAPGKASDKIRTHHLKEDNLSSILRPGKPAPHISATKGG